MFIQISNPAENVDRRYLEKLGLSTKRDNDELIGQFGSGANMAPISALRKGIRWVNAGTDQNGDYIMEYISKNVDGIDCVFFDYGDGNLKETSYTTEAGLLSWDDDFQIFREAFANALDAKTETGLDYEIVYTDKIAHTPGKFSVFLTATENLMNIVDNLDKYFTIGRKPIESGIDGFFTEAKLYEPIGDGVNRIYCKGVLVGEFQNMPDAPAIFDYDFHNVDLNEERKIKSDYSIEGYIADVLTKLTSNKAITKLISGAGHDFCEWAIPSYQFSSSRRPNDNITKEFYSIYGKDAVPISSSNIFFANVRDNLLTHGKEAVRVPDNLEKILISCGVKGSEEFLGEAASINIVEELSEIQSLILKRAVETVRRYIPSFDDVVSFVKVFNPSDGQNLLGMASMKDRGIYISSAILRDEDPVLLSTIIHEYDHLNTKFLDGSREFRQVADTHIGNLILMIDKANAWDQ